MLVAFGSHHPPTLVEKLAALYREAGFTVSVTRTRRAYSVYGEQQVSTVPGLKEKLAKVEADFDCSRGEHDDAEGVKWRRCRNCGRGRRLSTAG